MSSILSWNYSKAQLEPKELIETWMDILSWRQHLQLYSTRTSGGARGSSPETSADEDRKIPPTDRSVHLRARRGRLLRTDAAVDARVHRTHHRDRRACRNLNDSVEPSHIEFWWCSTKCWLWCEGSVWQCWCCVYFHAATRVRGVPAWCSQWHFHRQVLFAVCNVIGY